MTAAACRRGPLLRALTLTKPTCDASPHFQKKVLKEMTEKVAVYVVGNSSIFFPGLVALRSIQDQNTTNPFDYFMCFDGKDLTGEMDAVLKEHDIHFVDISDLRSYGAVDDLTLMEEQRFPVHVFCNWLFPYWLHDHGYQEALKVDYDLLCVDRYYLPDILPVDTTVSALKFDADLVRTGVSLDVLAELNIPVVDGAAVIPYYNAGVVGMNLERYVGLGTFAFFRYAYMTIIEGSESVKNAEQVALAIVAYHGDGVKGIPTAYNQRITILPELDAKGRPILKNIHYLTQNKPWIEPDYRYLAGYARLGRTGVYIYRDMWHRYAMTVPGYTKYVSAHSPTPMDTLAMYTTVFTAYDKR